MATCLRCTEAETYQCPLCENDPGTYHDGLGNSMSCTECNGTGRLCPICKKWWE